MLEHGYLRVARPWGVELRIHWTVVAGAVLAARLRLEPLIWLGFLGVVLTHELGHGLAVGAAGGQFVGLDVTGVGGSCRWRGTGTLLERAWVAWGGVLAQAALLAVSVVSSLLSGLPTGRLAAPLGYCFVEVNLALLALNLLPFSPLDGALAWRLFGALHAAGGSVRHALLGWVWRWARRRRERRQEGPLSMPAAPSAAPLLDPPRSSDSSGLAGDAPSSRPRPTLAPPDNDVSTDDGPRVDDEALSNPRPSEQAQREIDALLRRVQDRAARSRRGH
jgi:Zn-dependent protease